MRRRSAIVLAGALCVLTALAGSSSRPSAAQDEGTVGIRILDAPQNRADDPRARLYIVDHLAPGTTITRRVEVGNDTPKVQQIELYAGSATIEGAEFRFGEGRDPNDLTTWTRIEPPNLALQPGQRAVATVTIAVPRDASEGERYGVVWAETRAGATAEEAVGTVSRVGVRIYLSVGPGGEPATDFEIIDIEGRRDREGNAIVGAIVRNIGGRAVDLSGEVQLSNGPGGLSAGPVSAEAGTTIKPGQSGKVSFIFDPALPSGAWDAKITMRSGTTVREAEGTLTFPDGLGAVGGGELTGGNLLTLIIAILLLLLVAGFLLWFFWRRRKKKKEDEEGEAQD